MPCGDRNELESVLKKRKTYIDRERRRAQDENRNEVHMSRSEWVEYQNDR